MVLAKTERVEAWAAGVWRFALSYFASLAAGTISWLLGRVRPYLTIRPDDH